MAVFENELELKVKSNMKKSTVELAFAYKIYYISVIKSGGFVNTN